MSEPEDSSSQPTWGQAAAKLYGSATCPDTVFLFNIIAKENN
jgi:hypothetical protein